MENYSETEEMFIEFFKKFWFIFQLKIFLNLLFIFRDVFLVLAFF